MSRSDEERIADMLDAGAELADVVARGRDAYDVDHALRRACERLLEIVGEAAKGVSEQRRSLYQAASWRDAVRLRDLIAHHYHRVDPDQVWVVAAEHVPVLLAAIRETSPQ